MLRLLAFVFLLLSSLSVRALPCLSFDINFNLYAFGYNGKDYTLGTQDAWASATSGTDITATGRPPFDGKNTTCYLAQFYNAIYVLNGDAKNPNSIYIFDVAAKSWSAQSTTPGSFDPSSAVAILDHDTNVFYALSKGTLYDLDMGALKAANSTALVWNSVQALGFPGDYNPVMALAQNHIHFLDVGNDGPGTARIFVIHFSYLQPEVQSYSGAKTFPATHGQVASFFMSTGVQEEFAFIPDDFSATYVINVESNTTQALPPPTVKDTKSSYVAGITSLVQLDSTGGVSFLLYSPGNSSEGGNATSTNANAAWSSIKALPTLAPSSSGSSTSSSNGPQGTGGKTQSTSGGALSNSAVTSGLIGLSVLFAILGFL